MSCTRWTFDNSVQTAKVRAPWPSGDWDVLALKKPTSYFAKDRIAHVDVLCPGSIFCKGKEPTIHFLFFNNY